MKIDRTNLKEYNKLLKKENPIPILEQNELARLSQGGDSHSLNKLIKSNQRLAFATASRYIQFDSNSIIEMGDLIQVANIGMLAGIMKWDEDKGTLTNMIITWMRKELSDFVQVNKSTIKESIKQAYIRRFIESDTPISFDRESVLNEFKMMNKDISDKSLKTAERNLEFSSTSLDNYSNEFDSHPSLPSSDCDLINEFEEKDEVDNQREYLEHNIQKLSQRHQTLIRLHYFEDMSIKEIAVEQDKNIESIRGTLKLAIHNLKLIMC